MKRMIHSLLAAAVLVSAMTCTAFAGDYTADKNDYKDAYIGTVTTADNGKSFTVSYEGAIPGEEYVVLIVKTNAGAKSPYDASDYDNAAKEENIIYINQDTADSNGTIAFKDLIPMTSANAVVLLGGVFDGQQSPVILGELKLPFIYGDVFSDGAVSLKDAVKLLQYVAKVPGITLSDAEAKAADVFYDGSITLKDAVKLLQYVAKVPGITLP